MPNGNYILMELQSEDQARAVVGGLDVFTLFWSSGGQWLQQSWNFALFLCLVELIMGALRAVIEWNSLYAIKWTSLLQEYPCRMGNLGEEFKPMWEWVVFILYMHLRNMDADPFVKDHCLIGITFYLWQVHGLWPWGLASSVSPLFSLFIFNNLGYNS